MTSIYRCSCNFWIFVLNESKFQSSSTTYVHIAGNKSENDVAIFVLLFVSMTVFGSACCHIVCLCNPSKLLRNMLQDALELANASKQKPDVPRSERKVRDGGPFSLVRVTTLVRNFGSSFRSSSIAVDIVIVIAAAAAAAAVTSMMSSKRKCRYRCSPQHKHLQSPKFMMTLVQDCCPLHLSLSLPVRHALVLCGRCT